MDSLRVTIGGSGGFHLNFYCAAGQGEWGSTWVDCDNDDSPTYQLPWNVELAFSTSAAVGFAYRTYPTWSSQPRTKSVKGTWCRYGIILVS